VSAAIDVSDGLVADLGHICEMSGLFAVIDAPSVPLSAAARAALASRPARIETVLTGGDDYEILFTAPSESTGALEGLSRAFDVPITAIGHMGSPSEGEEAKVAVHDERGRRLVLEREGWTHF
jgi:thiamine-monophosphate kinase